MSQLLVATNNPGKLDEIRTILAFHVPTIKILSLRDMNISDECEENGLTYTENSLKKAQFYWNRTKMPVLTDDGGFEIDALDGAPGLHSRRFGGKVRTDEGLRTMFLQAVSDAPDGKRGATMRIVLTLMFTPQEYHQAEGKLIGEIRDSKLPIVRGYPARSIFWIPMKNKFLQEFTPQELADTTHRAQAVLALKPYLETISV